MVMDYFTAVCNGGEITEISLATIAPPSEGDFDGRYYRIATFLPQQATFRINRQPTGSNSLTGTDSVVSQPVKLYIDGSPFPSQPAIYVAVVLPTQPSNPMGGGVPSVGSCQFSAQGYLLTTP